MVDIIASVSSAISLAEKLEEKSNDLQDAELKKLLAELSCGLGEIRTQIADYLTEKADSNANERVLLGETCELCPACKNFTLELVSCKPHPIFGDIGGMDREMKCFFCGFREARYVYL